MRPASLAEVAERAVDDPDWHHHLDEFLDAFYGRDGDTIQQAAMIAAEPRLLGASQADAFLGGAGSIWRGDGICRSPAGSAPTRDT